MLNQSGPNAWRLPAVAAPLLVALFITGFDNTVLWRSFLASYSGGVPWLAFAGAFVMVTALFAAVLQVVNFPWLFKPLAVLLLVAAAGAGYFMSSYGVVIDAAMFRNLAQTDPREANELLTWRFFLHMALFAVLPAALLLRVELVRRPWRTELWRSPLLAIGWVVVALAAAASSYKDLSLTMRQHRELRLFINPSYPLYALVQYRREATRAPKGPLQAIGADATRSQAAAGGRPLLLMLVVGETARSMQFSLNGYGRETNPELQRLGVLSFTQVSSCGTSTAESLPCMFSHLGREHYEPAAADQLENLLDVLQRTGVAVHWRDNNAGCKGICARVPNDRPDPALCGATECHDETLLAGLDARLAPGRDTLLVLHQLGSHGPAYYKRTPARFKRFQPECAQENVKECARDTIVNAYDNTILYTDHVLASAIALLQSWSDRYDTALLYVSDHGESLGEYGIYLHGFPYRLAPQEQTRVPMIFWSSAPFAQRQRLDTACLAGRRDVPLSHDHLFHTMLGVYGVQTRVYDAQLDLLRPCRSQDPNSL